MNEALGDPAVQSVLPEDFQRHLQIVFASRLGFNLRNVVAHGLLPASQFSILTSLMALQGLLLMSLIEAKPKVVAKKAAPAKRAPAAVKKGAPKKAAPAKKIVAKKAPAKKVIAKQVSAKQIPAKKAVAPKGPAKKAPTKKGSSPRAHTR